MSCVRITKNDIILCHNSSHKELWLVKECVWIMWGTLSSITTHHVTNCGTKLCHFLWPQYFTNVQCVIDWVGWDWWQSWMLQACKCNHLTGQLAPFCVLSLSFLLIFHLFIIWCIFFFSFWCIYYLNSCSVGPSGFWTLWT